MNEEETCMIWPCMNVSNTLVRMQGHYHDLYVCWQCLVAELQTTKSTKEVKENLIDTYFTVSLNVPRPDRVRAGDIVTNAIFRAGTVSI